jgi:hypothetical protein
MIDVVIPPDRLSEVQPEVCAQWLVEHCEESAIGHVQDGTFLIRFDRPEDAESFSARWIN